MSNHFSQDEQNPLANFSLDPDDRLVHATTKRQAAVAKQNLASQSSYTSQVSTTYQESTTSQGATPYQVSTPPQTGTATFATGMGSFEQTPYMSQVSSTPQAVSADSVTDRGSSEKSQTSDASEQYQVFPAFKMPRKSTVKVSSTQSRQPYNAESGSLYKVGQSKAVHPNQAFEQSSSEQGYVNSNQPYASSMYKGHGVPVEQSQSAEQNAAFAAYGYGPGQGQGQGQGQSAAFGAQGAIGHMDAAGAMGAQSMGQYPDAFSSHPQAYNPGYDQRLDPRYAQGQAYTQGPYAWDNPGGASLDPRFAQSQPYSGAPGYTSAQAPGSGQTQMSNQAPYAQNQQSHTSYAENLSVEELAAQSAWSNLAGSAAVNGAQVAQGVSNLTGNSRVGGAGTGFMQQSSQSALGDTVSQSNLNSQVQSDLAQSVPQSTDANQAILSSQQDKGSLREEGSQSNQLSAGASIPGQTSVTPKQVNLAQASESKLSGDRVEPEFQSGVANFTATDDGASAGGNGISGGAADAGAESEPKGEGNFLYRWREERRAEKQAKKERKAAMKAGLIPPPTKWQKFKHFCHILFSLGWKMAIAGLCVCIGLFIYFDSVVIDEYEVDDKWVLPAVVYSRPLELYPDQRLSLEQMEYELQLLKYREVPSPRKQGDYALNKKNGRIVLVKRQFQFPEGEEPAMSVLIEFEDKRVKRIINAQTQQELGYMRMDPVLLDRINRINPQEDRIFITLEEVPQELITTLIEIEDRSYYSHMGVNPMAIARAFVKNMLAGGVVEGGSTITQQLVKNYFLTNERSYSRKLKEIFMAISMNHRYTKDQILEAYMNEIYLGQNGNAGIYGFGLASYFYFGVPVAELSLDQMALLVGLIKGPSYYDPWRHPENALERRNTVLAVLRNRGHISPERFEQESSKPLNVIARGQLNYTKTPAFMGLVKTEIGTRFKEEEERTGKDFLSGNGIRIFTSLDPQAQVAAETAVQNEIAAIEKERKLKNLEAAMIVSSWRTGEVSAVVGSSNPKFDGYNRVLDSKRQVGSLIKPFVYLTAFHQGYHLGSIVNDTPVQVKLPNGDIWAPKNDDKRFRGPIRVIRAMASSLNVPTVRIGMGSGLDNVINTLHAAGFKRDLDMYPSIVLGTPEISPYELNSMYVGMATEGIYRDLTTLRTIVKNGEIVYQRGSNRGVRTLDPKDTYLAIYGMTEATRSGTGRKISSTFPNVTIASKTGTTNDFRDSWTVGMDSDELSTVWVGFDNNKSTGLYGSTGAMRLYVAYLKERGVNSLELNLPAGVSFVNFDKQGNVLANGCEEPGMEKFPAREDRIQYVKQCNNFGEAGYDELPYAVPNRPVYSPNFPEYPAQPGSMGNANIPGASGALQQPQSYAPASNITPPSQEALQSSSLEDSQAKDVQPVAPEQNARPTQSSSSNIERQADSFEDLLLGL